jgi:peptide alpha-N-acetyltransferase
MSGKKDVQSTNPQAGLGIPLPKKETDLFRQVVRLYETKQYKKGLKLAESILKKFPNHGETLCMKGLVLNSMDKANREDAIATVKLGLRNDMRSHVCWHVYGLIYRSERNYNEAIKAYKQALRIDTQNIQILKDLALLQIQMRDIQGFSKTQHAILELKPNLKQHWVGFALAKHLLNDYRGAINVIDIFLGTLDPNSNSPDLSRNYETSELALYKNQILAEIPDNFQEALDHLEHVKDLIVDETSRLERKGYYELMLGHFEQAKSTYEELFQKGLTENYQVHSGYMCAILHMDANVCNMVMSKSKNHHNSYGSRTLASIVQLTEEEKKDLLHEYTSILMEKYPKSIATKRISLTLYSVGDDEWVHAIEEYIQQNIVRGVPSLGEDLSAFYLLPVQSNGSTPVLLELTTEPLEIKQNECYQHFCRITNDYMS